MSSESAGVVRFGPFYFDPSTGDVWTDERRLRLQEQPRHVLALLVARPGELVTRDELRHELWPDETFVDFDTGINVAITKLRGALGDSAAQPTYIETIPRKGYRFLATVAAGVGVAAEPSRPPLRPRRISALAAAIALVATIGGVVLAWRFIEGPNRTAGDRPQTMAVLPLANLTGEPSRDAFVDGLTYALVTEVADLEHVQVVARQSVVRYRGTRSSATDIARELNVDVIVDGSVVLSNTGFTVNLHLVDGRTGLSLFADRFARPDWRVVEIPAEVLERMARALKTSYARDAARSSDPVPVEALQAYLRARFFWNKRTPDGDRRALEYLNEALERHPSYALAWAAVADIYAASGDRPSTLITPWPGNPIEAGLQAAERALQLDANLGEAHVALGRLYMMQWRWDDALREARRGIELSPDYSTGRQWYGTLLMRLGRCAEALVQVEHGVRLDPLTPMVNEALGSVKMNCGDPHGAIPVIRQMTEMNPDVVSHYVRLGNASTYARDYAAAIDAYRQALKLTPTAMNVKANLGYALAALGQLETARSVLDEVVAAHAAGQVSPYFVAIASAGLADADRMFGALEQAVAAKDDEIAGLILQRRFWRFEGDQRYERILVKSGLWPYWREARPTLLAMAGMKP